MVDQLMVDLRSLAQRGLAIFLVEQDVATALELSDYAFVMDRGRIVRHGSSAELISDPMVQEAYIGSLG
jgi:branched-chain amino acid transport system ATP-binding protein